MPRVVIVGGGVLGTMHAVEARRRGWDVVHLDTDPEPQEATVRNAGLVWVTGRAPGVELELGLRARALWEELSRSAPGIGFRACGSLMVATVPEHLDVFTQLMARADSARRRIRTVGADALRELNPVVGGECLGALHGPLDAAIEPRLALPALREQLLAGDGYTFKGGRQIWEVDSGRVTDTAGRVHAGDLVIICAGAGNSMLANMVSSRAPLRRVRLQMLQTARLPRLLRTIVIDADAVRFGPGFAVPARDVLPAAEPVVEEFRIELKCVQRASGALTIGETHELEEPFGFDLSERPYDRMLGRIERLLGQPLPGAVRRWSGVYHECTDDRIWYREEVDQDVVVVTGAGGRGLSLAPAIAEDTFTWFEDGVDSGGSRPGAIRPSG